MNDEKWDAYNDLWFSVLHYMDPYQDWPLVLFLDYETYRPHLTGDEDALFAALNAAGCLDSGLL